MDRGIVYAASIPQDTDILKLNQNTMVALAMLSQAVFGTSTVVDGLACTAATPAGLSVLVGPGSIYSLANLEATAYGSISADTTDNVVKQGIVLGNTTLPITPPSTSGQSQVFLVQAQFQESDGTPVVLPYYNASNPSVPFSGPANSGTAQNTIRQGKCLISLKAGTAAATGSQTTPAADAGYVGLWAITVANGATTVTSGNIALYPGAPFITNKLNAKVATIKRQVFTASGTYTPSAGLVYAQVEVQGGGGGGGGAQGGSGSQASASTGGAEGGYCSKILTAAAIGSSQAVTVGAAGTNGAAGNTNGGGGGASSFGAIMTAAGGSPGGGNGTQSGISLSNAPGVGGTASGGDVNIQGGPGGYGIAFGGSSIGIGGLGANSRFGRGGPGGASGSGGNATGYGAGGGGAAASTSSQPGGSGSGGVVIVTEYCA